MAKTLIIILYNCRWIGSTNHRIKLLVHANFKIEVINKLKIQMCWLNIYDALTLL